MRNSRVCSLELEVCSFLGRRSFWFLVSVSLGRRNFFLKISLNDEMAMNK